MANTNVTITVEGDKFVPGPSIVSVIPGDTVTFHADRDLETSLCMPARTAAIFSPQPELRVNIPAGKSVTYAFAAGASGTHWMVSQAPDFPPPAGIPATSEGNFLEIYSGDPTNYPGPGDQGQT